MLRKIFDRAAAECVIDIIFRPDDKGKAKNDCRDELIAYVVEPTVPHGRKIANRLQSVTTHRSGLGLLFLMTGREGSQSRLVVSRFPADQGVIAEEHQQHLSVEFIERIFMKSSKAYKSAVYHSDSKASGFWDGKAIDRQISGPKELSDYWIREFLASELRTTGPAGTKRMAVALRDAIRQAESVEVKHELVSAAGLLRARAGQVTSGRQLVAELGISESATAVLRAALPRAELMDEVFRFDRDEFEKHVLYRWIELDNGGMLVAADDAFSDVFQREAMDAAVNLERFSTEGRVIDERLRRTK